MYRIATKEFVPKNTYVCNTRWEFAFKVLPRTLLLLVCFFAANNLQNTGEKANPITAIHFGELLMLIPTKLMALYYALLVHWHFKSFTVHTARQVKYNSTSAEIKAFYNEHEKHNIEHWYCAAHGPPKNTSNVLG